MRVVAPFGVRPAWGGCVWEARTVQGRLVVTAPWAALHSSGRAVQLGRCCV